MVQNGFIVSHRLDSYPQMDDPLVFGAVKKNIKHPMFFIYVKRFPVRYLLQQQQYPPPPLLKMTTMAIHPRTNRTIPFFSPVVRRIPELVSRVCV